MTRRLLEQAVRAPLRRPLEEIVEGLVDRAAARREARWLTITAAGRLSRQQEQRLLDVLTRIYRRPISLKVESTPGCSAGW